MRAWNDRRIVPRSVSRSHSKAVKTLIRQACWLLAAVLCANNAYALYDPPPDAALDAVQGEWQGTLTHRDYRPSVKMVTLPTRLFVALGGPSTLVLHYAFDDGPGKAVYSYETMTFDFTAQRVTWVSGAASERSETVARIVSNAQDGLLRRVVFDKPAQAGDDPARFTLELGAQGFALSKEKLPSAGPVLLRNRFVFKRPGQ